LLAQENGPPVTQVGEVSELMPRVGLRDRLTAPVLPLNSFASSPREAANGSLKITISGRGTGTGAVRVKSTSGKRV
jgi:hypothetical protein